MPSLAPAETLLFTGPDALKKALEKAQTLIGPLDNHPDFHRLIPEGSARKHTIASIQALIREIALPPYASRCKIFLIEEAEAMLPAAASALLKTLEEPPPYALIFLTSALPDSLLPTIRSRCKTFSSPPEKKPPLDLSSYFALAKAQNFSELLSQTKEFTVEDASAFVQALLAEGNKLTDHTQKLLEAAETARKALERNIRPRNVLLHFVLSLIF